MPFFHSLATRAKTLEREVVFDSGGQPDRRVTPFYDRGLLRASDRIEGPAIVEQYDSTTVIPPGLAAHVDRFGNIVIQIGDAADALEETTEMEVAA